MNIRAFPPIDVKPLPTEKVANGIWVVKPGTTRISDDQAASDYYRVNDLFSKPLVKPQKPTSEK